MKRNQRGFGAVEGLLLLIIVLLIGFISYYVYHTKNSAYKTLSTADKTTASSTAAKDSGSLSNFTNESGVYSLKYPNNWTVKEAPYSGDFLSDSVAGKTVNIIPDQSPTIASDTSLPNSVNIYAYKTADTNMVREGLLGDTNGTPEKLTINGVEATYIKVVNSGYTDDNYFLTHNGVTLAVIFREKQSSSLGGNATTFDSVKDLAGFQSLVKTIKFKN